MQGFVGQGSFGVREIELRIMGLDFGSKTVGVAVCDPLGLTAQALETVTRKEENKLPQSADTSDAVCSLPFL